MNLADDGIRKKYGDKRLRGFMSYGGQRGVYLGSRNQKLGSVVFLRTYHVKLL